MSNLNEITKESVQTVIIDSNDFDVKKNNIEKIHQILKEDGSLFVIVENQYEN